MSAIVTDQLRIINARNFVNEIVSDDSAYYSFVALTNPEDYQSDWDENPPAPKDSLNEEYHNWDTIVGLKRILPEDVKLAVRKIEWASGITYDMYKHNISRDNLSQPSEATNLYSANYYVINSNYRVYVCLNNGTDPENPNGRPSLDEPKFIDLEPKAAGASDDGYVWKYLFTINPDELVKFDTLSYITIPNDWETNEEYDSVRLNAEDSGQIKVVLVKNRGINVGPANRVYECNIIGDGENGLVSIVVNNQSQVESVTVSDGGTGYTFGTIDLSSGGFPESFTTKPEFEVIIPPKGGHGRDIYKELGTTRVLVFSQIKNDATNPDFIVGNKISRIGLISNPLSAESDEILDKNQASGLSAIRLIGVNDPDDFKNASFEANAEITQTIGIGVTAVGKVVSYNKNTGVLKFTQDRTEHGFDYNLNRSSDGTYGNEKFSFTSDLLDGGSLEIFGSNQILEIDIDFNGDLLVINNQNYFLGQDFIDGVSGPEVKKYSGDLIYVDNRPSITRSSSQREDIKIVLQF